MDMKCLHTFGHVVHFLFQIFLAHSHCLDFYIVPRHDLYVNHILPFVLFFLLFPCNSLSSIFIFSLFLRHLSTRSVLLNLHSTQYLQSDPIHPM